MDSRTRFLSTDSAARIKHVPVPMTLVDLVVFVGESHSGVLQVLDPCKNLGCAPQHRLSHRRCLILFSVSHFFPMTMNLRIQCKETWTLGDPKSQCGLCNITHVSRCWWGLDSREMWLFFPTFSNQTLRIMDYSNPRTVTVKKQHLKAAHSTSKRIFFRNLGLGKCLKSR